MEMDYYPSLGYRTDNGRYYEQEEFIDPREDQEDFRKPILPRNRRRWDFDTDDIAFEPFYGDNRLVGSRKAGRYANSDPYETFRKQTYPLQNKQLVQMEDQLYPNLDITQIMDWTYFKPKINNNGPIFDHKESSKDRTSFDTQTPRVIKPIKDLNSIGGMYMQDMISQENFRDRRWGVDMINKFYATPRLTVRPDRQDVDGIDNLFRICKNREKVSKFVSSDQFVPFYEFENQPQEKRFKTENYHVKPEQTPSQNALVQLDVKMKKPTVSDHNQLRAEYIPNQNALVNIDNIQVRKQNIRNGDEKQNIFLGPQSIQPCDFEISKPCVPQTKLAWELENQVKITPYYQEVQFKDFDPNAATIKHYMHNLKEIKSYLKTNEAQYDTSTPFYLDANEKETRAAYKVFDKGNMYLAIHEEALSPYTYQYKKNPVCNEKYNKFLDLQLEKTTPSYLVQGPIQEVQPRGHVDKKEKGQNIFLADMNSDEIHRPKIEKETNKVKSQIRSTSNIEKPVKITVRKK